MCVRVCVCVERERERENVVARQYGTHLHGLCRYVFVIYAANTTIALYEAAAPREVSLGDGLVGHHLEQHVKVLWGAVLALHRHDLRILCD